MGLPLDKDVHDNMSDVVNYTFGCIVHGGCFDGVSAFIHPRNDLKHTIF